MTREREGGRNREREKEGGEERESVHIAVGESVHIADTRTAREKEKSTGAMVIRRNCVQHTESSWEEEGAEVGGG